MLQLQRLPAAWNWRAVDRHTGTFCYQRQSWPETVCHRSRCHHHRPRSQLVYGQHSIARGKVPGGRSRERSHPGAGGGMTTWFELWRATIDNEVGREHHMGAGRRQCGHEPRSLPWPRKRRSTCVTPRSSSTRTSWRCFRDTSYDDGRDPDRDQLRLFTIRIPPAPALRNRRTRLYRYDITSMLETAAHLTMSTISAPGRTHRRGDPRSWRRRASCIRPQRRHWRALAFRRNDVPGCVANRLRIHRVLSNLGGHAGRQAAELRRQFDVAISMDRRAVIHADIMAPIQRPTSGHHRRKYRDGDSGLIERCLVVCDPTQRRDQQSDIDREPRGRCRENGNTVEPPMIRMPWTLADRLLSEGRTFYQVASLRLLLRPRVMMPGLTRRSTTVRKLQILMARWRVPYRQHRVHTGRRFEIPGTGDNTSPMQSRGVTKCW